MNLNNNWHKSSSVRIPLLAALVYAYFCAPISLEHKALVQPITASTPHNATADGYDPRRDPDKDLAAASEEAKRTTKNIFVVVGGEWCSWCHALDHFFHEHPDVAALRDKHIVILDANGKLIQSQPTNELEDGRSYNVKRFKAFLEGFALKSI